MKYKEACLTLLLNNIDQMNNYIVKVIVIIFAMYSIAVFGVEGCASFTDIQNSNDPKVVQFRNLLIRVRQSMDLIASIALARAELASSEEIFGPTCKITIVAMTDLARAYEANTEYFDAIPLYRKALETGIAARPDDLDEQVINLNNLGLSLVYVGRYEEALPFSLKALALSTKRGDSSAIAIHTNNLALLYFNWGQMEQALSIYSKVLKQKEDLFGPDSLQVAWVYKDMGMVYESMNQPQEAKKNFDKALSIRLKNGKEGEYAAMDSWDHLAKSYELMGRYGEALPLYEKIYQFWRDERGDESNVARSAKNELAGIYSDLGREDLAIPIFENSLKICQAKYPPVHHCSAGMLFELSLNYARIGRMQEAITSQKKALEIQKKLTGEVSVRVARGLNNLGQLYREVGQHKKSLPISLEALRASEQTTGRESPDFARSALNLALLYDSINRPQDAQKNYQIALTIGLAEHHKEQNPVLLFEVTASLCSRAAMKANKIDEAIFYCKLSVNASKKLRAGAKYLPLEMRTSLTKREEAPYKLLATLLMTRHRLIEAEDVLLSLKDAEYLEFVRGNSPSEMSDIASLTPSEIAISNDLGNIAVELRGIYAKLEFKQLDSVELPPDEVASLQARRDLLQQQMTAKLENISVNLKPSIGGTEQLNADNTSRLTRIVRELSNKYHEQSALIMYVPEESSTTVLVVTNQGPTAIRLPIGLKQLEPLIRNLRIAIQNKGAYSKISRALFNFLIARVQKDLNERKVPVTTLMLYTTDVLSSLPFSVLLDPHGKHLIESYRLSSFNAASLNDVTTAPILDWSVSAFGSSLATEGRTSLPAVEEELRTIVRSENSPLGLLPGIIRMDSSFSRSNWLKVINGQPIEGTQTNNVVHVATHFVSGPGDWDNSFLQLGDGDRYVVSELGNALSADMSYLDLMTLSACSTEISDKSSGKRFEGLGVMFQKRGVRSVIGTLWEIQDEGSAAFMREFYAARGEHRIISKAQALQSAQINLLKGMVKSKNPNIDLSLPYYWAPFVLMGNWL